MTKNKSAINFTIGLLLMAAFALGIMLTLIYKNSYANKTNFNISFKVTDTTDVKELRKISNENYQRFISESIEKVVSKEFDRTTNYLNYTIVLFAVFLTLILVVFGFFTVKKMTEAKELLEAIMAAPESMMTKYYQNQISELIPNLISSNSAVKSDTISKLYSNTELDKEKHYDMLSKIMEQEYYNITSYTTMNVLNLFEILCRLDYSKTIDLGYQIFSKHYSHRSMDFLVPLLLESPERKHKTLFHSYLSDTSNPNRTNKLIQNVENFDIYDNKTLKYLVKNASPNVVFRILNSLVQKRKGEIEIVKLMEDFDERLFTYPYFNQSINLLRQNNQLENKLVLKFLERIKSDSLNTNQVQNLIRNLISYLPEDDDLVKGILIVKEIFDKDIDYKKMRRDFKQENNTRLVNALDKIKNEKK